MKYLQVIQYLVKIGAFLKKQWYYGFLKHCKLFKDVQLC